MTPATCARTSTLFEAAASATHSNLAGTVWACTVKTVTSGGGGPAGEALRHAAIASTRTTRFRYVTPPFPQQGTGDRRALGSRFIGCLPAPHGHSTNS